MIMLELCGLLWQGGVVCVVGGSLVGCNEGTC